MTVTDTGVEVYGVPFSIFGNRSVFSCRFFMPVFGSIYESKRDPKISNDITLFNISSLFLYCYLAVSLTCIEKTV